MQHLVRIATLLFLLYVKQKTHLFVEMNVIESPTILNRPFRIKLDRLVHSVRAMSQGWSPALPRKRDIHTELVITRIRFQQINQCTYWRNKIIPEIKTIQNSDTVGLAHTKNSLLATLDTTSCSYSRISSLGYVAITQSSKIVATVGEHIPYLDISTHSL